MTEKETEKPNITADDIQKAKETIDSIVSALIPIIKDILDKFKIMWERIDGNTLIYYQKIYNQSSWKYIKKGKKYVKVRRKNSEDISKVFSKRMRHYFKHIQR